jgi:hypothetical protein
MFLISLLLSVVTFNPAMLPHQGTVVSRGVITGNVAPDAQTSCQPGDICASTTVKFSQCFYVNYIDSNNGGTPLTIDVTETNSKKTYVYWINTYYKPITIKGKAKANYYCY